MQILSMTAAAVLITLAVPGVALAASKTYEPGTFTELRISSGVDAKVTVGGTIQSVVAESPRQEELDELIVEVTDGKLHVHRDWDFFDLFNFGPGDNLQTVVTISVPALVNVESSSGADVQVTGLTGDRLELQSSSGADLRVTGAAGREFELDSSSGSDLEVDGTCERASANSSSGSDLRADKLLCAEIDVDASSGSSAQVYASATLRAEASSGANVDVYGKPKTVDQETSSGGDVELR